MAIETRVAQKDNLFVLLRLKKFNQSEGIKVHPYLNEVITRAKSSMDAEDVAYVEKMVMEEE